MHPKLENIDHIHIQVTDLFEAAKWYAETLGFHIVEEYRFWAEDDMGPLTIASDNGKIHLALFQRKNPNPITALALSTDGQSFLDWKKYLEEQEMSLHCSDHDKTWSLYFNDPYGNNHEITTYDYEMVTQKLK